MDYWTQAISNATAENYSIVMALLAIAQAIENQTHETSKRVERERMERRLT